MKKLPIQTLAASLILACASAGADVFVLKNGDKISGEVLSKTEETTSVKTPYATIELLNSEIESSASALPDTAQSQQELAKDAIKPETSTATEAKTPEAKTAEEQKQLEEAKSYIEQYKEFIHGIVPEGWEFKVSGAVEFRKTSSQTTAYTFAFDAAKKWGEIDDFKLHAYYDYAYEKGTLTDTNQSYRNKTTDKYGVVTNYKHYFEEGSNWYLTNMLGYSVDMIKGIKDQVDEIVGIGRTFKFLDDSLVISISVGPSVRYVNAVGYSEHWVPMATVMEELTYRFHKYSRLEQSFFAGVSLTNVHKYNYIFNIGVVFEISDVVNLAARYMYSYDAVNSGSAQKSEERLTLGFEIPFK